MRKISFEKIKQKSVAQKMMKREAVLFLVVVFWMKRGEVLGQCEGDVSPIQYDSDGTCNIHEF